MKWLEKNWVIVAVVVVGYMWLNGTLGNLFSGTPAPAVSTSGTTIMGG